MKNEEWRPIPQHPGFEASSHGRIRRPNGKLDPQCKNPNGYYQICINQVTKGVHRLVAYAFIPNPENLPQINHKNGIKADNRPANLEWVSCSRNMLHAYQTGLTTAHPTHGEACNLARITEDTVRAIYRAVKCDGQTHKKASEMYGVSRSLVGFIINRKRWSHLNLS